MPLNNSSPESQRRDDNRKLKEKIFNRISGLTSKNGYQFIQNNGQRVYSPSPELNLPTPAKGCEIFIGKLPKHIYEDELIPLFEKVGKLYMFRLMLDFTEKNRGFAFATYFNKKVANEAVRKYYNYEIRPKLRIAVYKSVDNRRLFIGNIPTDKSREEIFNELNKITPGIHDIIMYEDWLNPGTNRGFVFAEFETHALAALARRQFNPENLIIWKVPLYVDWADPLPEVEPRVMRKVTVLYLKNLPVMYSSEQIHTLICKLLEERVTKTHKINHFAFIHFTNRRDAETAKEKLEGLCIDNREVEVEWARPRKYSKKNRLMSPPPNFCTSVPPSMRKMVRQRLGEVITTNRRESSLSTSIDSVVSAFSPGIDMLPYSYFNGKCVIDMEKVFFNYPY